jgi:hypothetical protein
MKEELKKVEKTSKKAEAEKFDSVILFYYRCLIILQLKLFSSIRLYIRKKFILKLYK